MFQKLHSKSKTVWVVLVLLVLSITGIGMFVTHLQSSNNRLPSKVYFGEPAIAPDLLIGLVDISSVNLIGKWDVESINTIPVVPADDWLEKPAKAYIHFKNRDDEIVLIGYFGCNGFGGKAYVLEGQLQIPELTITQRGCSNDALAVQESALINILSTVGIWTTLQTQNASAITVGSQEVGFVQLRRLHE